MKKGLYVQEIEFNFYSSIKKQINIKKSDVPNIVAKSSTFKNLLDSKILEKVKRGRGFNYIISKTDSFNNFYNHAFPNPNTIISNEIDNQLKFKNTKATRVQKERVIFIRGSQNIFVNESPVNLSEITHKFGLFSAVLQSLKADKICFVENLQPFLEAENLLGDQYTYIHFYGRLPKKDVLKTIQCEEYLHFGDYDFTGLNEFLRASEIYKKSSIHMPHNFNFIFEKYAQERKKKDTQFKNIVESKNKDVITIREKILNSNCFLEQQILFGEIYD